MSGLGPFLSSVLKVIPLTLIHWKCRIKRHGVMHQELCGHPEVCQVCLPPIQRKLSIPSCPSPNCLSLPALEPNPSIPSQQSRGRSPKASWKTCTRKSCEGRLRTTRCIFPGRLEVCEEKPGWGNDLRY